MKRKAFSYAALHWLGVVVALAAMIALVSVRTTVGLAAALGLIFVALLLFTSGHRGSPFATMRDRRRGSH